MTKYFIINTHGVLTPRKLGEVPKTIKRTITREVIEEEEVSSDNSFNLSLFRELKSEFVKELAIELGRVIGQSAPRVVTSHVYHDPNQASSSNLEIDESVVVTKIDTNDIEKKFTQIADTKTTQDNTVQSSINKLKNLKKGE